MITVFEDIPLITIFRCSSPDLQVRGTRFGFMVAKITVVVSGIAGI